jgi:hypothetical protein
VEIIMTTGSKSDALWHLTDALSEDILNTGADELFAEVAQDHQSPRTLATEFDRISWHSLRRARRQRLVERLRRLIDRLANLRWPTFSGWQWSGLGGLAAATAAIAVFGFQFWQQPSRMASNHSLQSAAKFQDRWVEGAKRPAGTTNPSPGAVLGVSPPAPSLASNNPQQLRPERRFQIAMVTLENRSVSAEGVRRTRGLPAAVPAEPEPFRDIDIPTDLLQRAITSASNDKGAAEHSELMNLLHAQNDTYNDQARILIDSALADNLSKKNVSWTFARSSRPDQRDSTEVRVYDLDDLRAANIRSKIEPPPKDGHFLFLTVRQ